MTKFALIPLLKTINFSIEENEKYKNLKEAINYKIFYIKIHIKILQNCLIKMENYRKD